MHKANGKNIRNTKRFASHLRSHVDVARFQSPLPRALGVEVERWAVVRDVVRDALLEAREQEISSSALLHAEHLVGGVQGRGQHRAQALILADIPRIVAVLGEHRAADDVPQRHHLRNLAPVFSSGVVRVVRGEEMPVETIDHPPRGHFVARTGQRSVVVDGLCAARAELPTAAALNGRFLERIEQLRFVHEAGDVGIGGSKKRDGRGGAEQRSEDDDYENKGDGHGEMETRIRVEDKVASVEQEAHC